MYTVTQLRKGVNPTGQENIAYIDALYRVGLIGIYHYPTRRDRAVLNEFVIPKTKPQMKELKRKVKEAQRIELD